MASDGADRSGSTQARPRLLVVLGDGGHTVEIVRLVELLGPAYDYHYVAADGDLLSERRLTVPGVVSRISMPTVKGRPRWQCSLRLVRSLFQALSLCRRVRPLAVLGSGPSLMVPVAVAARAAGSKVIFVETGSRVTRLSLTGRLMLHIADIFFVQWEQLCEKHPTALFAGRLL